MLESSLEKAVIEGIQLGARVVNAPDDEKVEKLQLVDDYKGQWKPLKPKAVHKSGTFVAPASGKYTFTASGDLSHILAIDAGISDAAEEGYMHGEGQQLSLKEGQLVHIELAYWASEGDLSVNVEFSDLKAPPKSAYLTYRLGFKGFGAMTANRLGEVVLTPSVPNAPAKQRWAYDAATGQIESAVGRKKCLTLGNVTDIESVTRTPLVVADCSDATDQHWTWVSDTSGKKLIANFSRGALMHTETEQCILGEFDDEGSILGLGACPGDNTTGTGVYMCTMYAFTTGMDGACLYERQVWFAFTAGIIIAP